MFRVLDSAGTVIATTFLDLTDNKTKQLTKVEAEKAAQRFAVAAPGKKFYILAPIAEVEVKLPEATIIPIKQE